MTTETPSLAPNDAPPSAPTPETMTDHQKFIETLPEELRADPLFKNHTSWDTVAKSYKSAASMVGLDKNQVLRLPNDDTPEAWGEIYNKLGRPETADKYTLEKFVEAGVDKEALSEYAQIAHASGVSDKAFQALVSKVIEKGAAGSELTAQQTEQQVKEWQSSLKTELGAAYDEKLSLAKTAVKTLGGEALIKEISAKPEIFENPAIIKTFVAMGEQLQKIAIQTKEDNGFLPGQSNAQQAMTPNEAKAAIAALDADPVYKKAQFDSTHPQRKSLMEKRAQLFKYAYPGT
jgi:hypothetical protein